MYGHGGHLDHVTITIFTNKVSLSLRRYHIKFVFDWLKATPKQRRCLLDIRKRNNISRGSRKKGNFKRKRKNKTVWTIAD